MAGLGGSLALSLRQLADEGGPQHQGRAHGVREACPGAELSVLSGGQPVYYYIISVE